MSDSREYPLLHRNLSHWRVPLRWGTITPELVPSDRAARPVTRADSASELLHQMGLNPAALGLETLAEETYEDNKQQ